MSQENIIAAQFLAKVAGTFGPALLFSIFIGWILALTFREGWRKRREEEEQAELARWREYRRRTHISDKEVSRG